MNLVLNPQTEQALERIYAKPPHALLIIGPEGIGKHSLVMRLAGTLLDVPNEAVEQHPYIKIISNATAKSISIEVVRELGHFLALRPPVIRALNRLVIIEQAQTLTKQAQNALLKTIEEPPAGTVIILSASDDAGLLPTIQSRMQRLAITPPGVGALKAYFATLGFSSAAIDKALLMSGGLPGLTQALLSDDQSHPLVAATEAARKLLQQSTFEHVIGSEALVKDAQGFLNVIYMLERMAEVALQNPTQTPTAVRRWSTILRTCHETSNSIRKGAQAKLVALDFLLSL